MADQLEQDYLGGKRIYRASGHGPEPGRKDPSGYIKRENRNQNKDKRSGLAAAALRVRDNLDQQQGQQNSLPFIPQELTPVGVSGLMKDRTGRLYRGSPAPQAPTA